MNTLKIKEFIKNLINESFINKALLFLSELYYESFISKIFNLIRNLYYDSFIFKVFKKEDEEICFNVKFFKIKYEGNYKTLLIFFIIISIPYILKIGSLSIKILIFTLLYFIFLFLFIKEDLIKDSFLYKLLGGKND
ncbi:MAG: hypothetical protein N3D74_03860 [Caldisericia bacterium]|nr:hypothetical protein [Caldisericia bacterium]